MIRKIVSAALSILLVIGLTGCVTALRIGIMTAHNLQEF